jgi:hypothetical protein
MVNPKAMGALAVILLAGGLIYASQFGLSFGVAGKEEYAEIKPIVAQLESAVAKKDPAALQAFWSENQNKVERLKVQIESQGPGADKRLLQLMFLATRDHIPNIATGDATSEARLTTLKLEMKEAAERAGDTN